MSAFLLRRNLPERKTMQRLNAFRVMLNGSISGQKCLPFDHFSSFQNFARSLDNILESSASEAASASQRVVSGDWKRPKTAFGETIKQKSKLTTERTRIEVFSMCYLTVQLSFKSLENAWRPN